MTLRLPGGCACARRFAFLPIRPDRADSAQWAYEYPSRPRRSRSIVLESIAGVYDFSDEPANQRLLLEAARIVDRLDQLMPLCVGMAPC